MSTTTLRMATVGTITLQRPAFEDIILYRIQLRITTGTGDDAGTDDFVHVKLHGADTPFYLVKGIDNFVAGRTEIYDVLPTHVKRIRDIQFLEFGIRGNDGMYIKRIELILNNNPVPVFSKTYNGRGTVMDNDTPGQAKRILITGAMLRASPNWKYTPQNADMWQPLRAISKEMICSLVEAAIGHQISVSDDDIAWGSKAGFDSIWGPAVEAKFVNGKTLRFDLDLQRQVTGPNPELDVDFDLEFACVDGKINMVVKNIVFGTNWVGNARSWITGKGLPMLAAALGTLVGQPVAGTVAGGLLAKFLAFSLNFNPQSPNSSISCKTITVTPGCDIDLF